MARISRLRFSLGTLVFLTLLSGFILTNSYTFATDDEDAISCTLSYSVDSEHTVTATNNSYTTDIGTTTFSAVCNDNAGFAIYTVGYSNNEYGNNKMLANVNNTLDPTYDIATGTATSGDTSNWAMKLSAVSGDYTPTIVNNFNSYSSIPNEYTKAVSFPSTTDDTVGSELRSTYAIYLSSTQPAGTYTGEVKYTLVHPQTEEPCGYNRICYRKNGDDVIGGMGKQTANEETATLWATNFKRAGYGFAGWNTRADGTGTSYGPNQTITLPNDMEDGLILYAMWVASAGDLQDWEGCYNMSVGQVTALTDTRDNDTYAVAKLADGNCWLIENLRLGDVDGNNNAVILSSSNTHNPSLPITNSLDQSTGEILTSSNSLSASQNPAVDNWCTDNNSICDDQSKIFRGNVTNPVENMVVPNTSIRSYGTYYNWYSATAGNGTYGFEGAVSGDICPSNWFLPYGGSGTGRKGGNTSGGYYYLGVALGATEDSATSSAIARSYPVNFVYGGQITGLSTVQRGVSGAYWTSTGGVNGASSFNIAAASFNPGTGYNNKNYGRQVRCATKSIQSHNVTVSFDDGVSGVVLSSNGYGTKTVNTSGTTITLKDGVEYTISATYNAEKDFGGWITTANGTLGSASSAETTYTVSGTATLTLYSKKDCSQGHICYDQNNKGSNASSGDMGNQTVSSASATLWVSNFKRDGYGFAGWNTKADGTGTSYGPNETIEFDTTDEDGLLLYAMWVESEGDLQDWNCPNNTIMPIGTVIGLTDTRDNQTYAVAKLADSNCWMIENLRLADKDSSGNDINLDSSYTNNPSLPLTNVYDATNPTTSNHLSPTTSVNYNPSTAPEGWCSYNNAACLDQSRLRTDNTVLFTNNTSSNYSSSNNVYGYGNYYNWYSATAGHGTYAKSSGDTAGDICPAGWHLPTGGSANSEFVTLDIKLGGTGAFQTGDAGTIQSNKWRSYPNNFIYNGYVAGSSINYRGSSGNYWSSSAADNTRAHSVGFAGGGIDPSLDLYVKNSGRAARCIIHKTTIDNLEYMQNFANLTADEKTEVLDSMVQDQQYQLVDERDNKVYYVSKLADGKIWMTQNLDLDLDSNTTYTHADTDLGWGGTLDATATWTPAESTKTADANGEFPDWINNYIAPVSADPGDWYYAGYDGTNLLPSEYVIYLTSTNRDTVGGVTTVYNDANHTNAYFSDSPFNTNGVHGHVGNYYNWSAAVARNDTSNYSGDSIGDISNNPQTSICPAGWRLPTISNESDAVDGSTNEFARLNRLYNNALTSTSSGLEASPLFFTRNGSIDGGLLRHSGYAGMYWSSTYDKPNYAYLLTFDNFYVGPRHAGIFLFEALPVRCVMR